MNYAENLILQKLLKIIISIIIIPIFDDLKITQNFHYLICNFLYKTLNNIKKYYKIYK